MNKSGKDVEKSLKSKYLIRTYKTKVILNELSTYYKRLFKIFSIPFKNLGPIKDNESQSNFNARARNNASSFTMHLTT